MNLPIASHPEQHLTSSVVLQDIVIGLSNDLTVPFALAAGLCGAVSSSSPVITAGLADELTVPFLAAGLSGYLAGRTEVEHYAAGLAREHEEVQMVPDVERREVKELLAEMALSPATQEAAMREPTADPEQWVKFMMKHELGLEELDARQAPKAPLPSL